MGEPIPPDQLRAVGERIDVLLDASGAGGVVARERAEELVRLVADLYGAGLERILEVMYDAGRLDDEVLAALAADDLVASLLLVHGLHPYDVTTRVEQALEGVRPYLGSHGGDVELLDVSEDGVVRLRLLGSCDGCPSSSVTLKLAVEGAIEAAAPEITSIEVEDAPAEPASDGLISVDALWSRVSPAAEGQIAGWHPLSGIDTLADGEVVLRDVAGTDGPGLPARIRPVRLCRRVRPVRGLVRGRGAGAAARRGRGRGGAALPGLPRALRRPPRRQPASTTRRSTSSRSRC